MDQDIYQIVPFGPGIIHTPPALYLHASENRGHLAILVLFAPHLLACLQFENQEDLLRVGVSVIQPLLQPFMAAHMAVNSPHPPGIPIEA